MLIEKKLAFNEEEGESFKITPNFFFNRLIILVAWFLLHVKLNYIKVKSLVIWYFFSSSLKIVVDFFYIVG